MKETLQSLDNITIHIFYKYDSNDHDMWEKLLHICKLAEVDPHNTIPHCFTIEYKDNIASILYQFVHGKISIILLEDGYNNNEFAVMAWTRINDMIIGPRRVYKTQKFRNTDILMKIGMPILEAKYSLSVKYIVCSFNNHHHGRITFKMFKTKKFFKTFFNSNPDYLNYNPLLDYPVFFIGTEQFLIYKKLGDYPDLTLDYLRHTYKSYKHTI